MAVFNWDGGAGRFGAALDWLTRGADAGSVALLAVDFQAGAALDAGFAVDEQATLTAGSADGSGMDTEISSAAAQNTISVTAKGSGAEATLELDGPVGAGTTIDINGGRLLIDQPLSFAGTLNIHRPEGGVTASEVVLRGLAASSYTFDDTTHALTLFDGDSVLDTVQFRGTTAASDFRTVSPDGFIDVAQREDGVQLLGSYDLPNSAGGTEIPLHAATG